MCDQQMGLLEFYHFYCGVVVLSSSAREQNLAALI